MLAFDSLELIGFKSFADKVGLSFDGKITAVIGPNGCGKSNLFDAIDWVLGTQSARNLRSEKMEDVIFNGSGKRKPSGLAQVTLRLKKDESTFLALDGQPLEGDILEISRKLYRSGESLYLVNQKRSRLKDIHQVLEDVGLGYSSYAMIAQGRIDSFLTGKPLDRRALIEEAAQITNFKSRRRSAEVRLEMAQQNLLRVNDIVVEVERNLRSLKRQAARARRYREIKEQFREVQRLKLASEWIRWNSRLREVESQIQQLEHVQEGLHQEYRACEAEYRSVTETRDRLENELTTARQNRSALLLEIDRSERAIQYLKEQCENSAKLLNTTEAEAAALRSALEQAAGELENLKKEDADLREEENRLALQINEEDRLSRTYRTEIEALEKRLDQLRTEILKLSSESASLGNLKEQTEQRIKELVASQQRVERESADQRHQLEETLEGLRKQQELMAARKAELLDRKEKLAKKEAEKNELESRLMALQREELELNNRQIAFRERLQSLQEVELTHSQYSEGVRKFLNHLSRSRTVQTSGTLADRIETRPEYERLVEAFLDDELEYVLVESMDQAVQGLSELKSLNSGKCTFLSIQSSNGFGKLNGNGAFDPQILHQSGVHGTLSDILSMDDEIEAAFKRVLPAQAHTVVVSDLGRAFDLAHSYPQQTFITLEGETLTPRGLLSGTSAEARKLGLLSLKRQKKDLEKKAAEVKAEQARMEKLIHKTSERLESARAEWAQGREAVHQFEKDMISLGHEIQRWEADRDRRTSAVKVLEDEGSRLAAEEKRLREKVRQVEQEQETAQGRRVEVEGLLEEGQSQLGRLKEESRQLLERLHKVSSDRKVLEERRAAMGRTRERVLQQRASLEGRLNDCHQRSQDLQSKIREMEESSLDLSDQLREKAAENEVLEEAVGRLESELNSAKAGVPEIEARLGKIRESLAGQQAEHGRLDVEKARLETQLQNLEDQCLEQLQQGAAEAAQGIELEGVSYEELSEQYQNLRDQLESFGPINMTALEEFQENEERFNFLTSQRQDIEQSIADTLKAIQDLNRRSREKFKEAFEAVNGHFQQFFEKLFGGGECGMRLLDEEDLLESGLDIYAQPPGKKLQNVMLLSGGEKALTVLALLMGLFAYRPSRFCILDEVDAPLDDANVVRFTKLLQEMSEQTQLTLITHNKRTMEVANSLYGVTMSEPGVSQVVSVQF